MSEPHNPGYLVAVTKRERVLTDTKVSARGRMVSVRWLYDTRETLACGCVIVYPRRDPPTADRRRCRA